MACIELALSYRPFGSFTLVPEPTGGEDAILQWGGTSPARLEVQVKGASGMAGIARLADYLTHYPPQMAKSSLLQRLIEEDDRHALFILTARCTDELTPLLLKRPLMGRPGERNVPSTSAEALRNEIAKRASTKPPKGASNLKLARLGDLKALAKRSISDFQRALAKTSLVDQESAETIEVRLHAALRAERFDTLSIRGILASFGDHLAASKRLQSDALAPILKEIAARAPSALRPSNYHERGIEGDLEAQLCRDHSLLLAGPPRAGKSWTARAVSGRLQLAGYEVRQGSFVEEAERFLTDSVGAERVYVLDDPIGSREPHSNASALLAALGALCERIPANRYLVVAQSEQVLLQTKGARDLSACKLGDRPWLRLEPLSVTVANDIWISVAGMQFVPAQSISRVSKLLVHETRLRDPGALAYLAQTWGELGEDPTDEEILLQARKDASDFARSLASHSPGLRALLTASALATTASDGVAANELAFIVNGEGDRPALAPEHEAITVLGDDPPRPPPTYASEQRLDKEQQHELDFLQRRRVIANQDNRFNFTHPYLRAGAQTLVTPEIPSDLQHILAQLERAISSPRPSTALAAARNLRWLRSSLRDSGSDVVFEVARQGTRSVFPATRDCCFEFLVESVDLLPHKLREELPRLSERMVIDLERIDVAHGIGFISDKYDWGTDTSSLVELKPYLDAIEEGAPLGLDLSLSRRILQTLRLHPEALTAAAVRRFLRADEAVVRASAARIWVQLPRENDEDVLARIGSDPTPAMSTELLKGLSRCWETLSERRRERILAILADHAQSPGCASVLISRLVLFNRREHFGVQPPWRVFITLMPIVIANLPLGVSFADGRFRAVIDDAIQANSPDILIPVLEEWAKRLLQRVDRYVLTESELDIVWPLLEVSTSGVRLSILRDLLGASDTGAKVVITRRLAECWEKLVLAERELLVDVLTADRGDACWLSASVLTQSDPPPALVAALVGDPKVLELPTEEIERSLHTSVFYACVHMFAGWPQPLWWYGTHHSDNPNWIRVIRDLASNPGHPLHAVAFYEIASFGEEEEFAKLIGELPEAALPDTFERLLDFKVSRVGDWRTEAWLNLLTRASEADLLDGFFVSIDAALDGILEELSDIPCWLGDSDFTKRVLRLLLDDIRGITHAHDLRKVHAVMREMQAENADIGSTILNEILAEMCATKLTELEKAPPRIFGSWGEIGRIFKIAGASKKTLSTIEARRLEAIERHQAIRDHFKGSPDPVELRGWIDRAHPDK